MSTKPRHAEPEHVRRKLADVYRREADNRQWKKKERAAFALMADLWEKTLQKYILHLP